MDEETCRQMRPKSLSYIGTIMKNSQTVKISKVFPLNQFIRATFLLEDVDDYKPREVKVNLTKACSKDEYANAQKYDPTAPKYQVTIFEATNQDKFYIFFMINQEFMVDPNYVVFTEEMGAPYYFVLKPRN